MNPQFNILDATPRTFTASKRKDGVPALLLRDPIARHQRRQELRKQNRLQQIHQNQPPTYSVILGTSLPGFSNWIGDMNSTPPVQDYSRIPGSFVVKEVPGKGLGLMASSEIKPGSLILSELPFLMVRQNTPRSDFKGIIDAQLAELDPILHNKFYSYQNWKTDNTEREVGIVLSNAMPGKRYSADPDDYEAGMYDHACRLNHSCDPNAHYSYDEITNRLLVYAVKAIKAGEEITVAYINTRRERALRQTDLMRDFGFLCTCRLCTHPSPDDQRVSDERMILIANLEAFIKASFDADTEVRRRYQAAQGMLGLLAQEDLHDANSPWVYRIMFQMAVAFGDIPRAKIFGMRAVHSHGVICGWHSTSTREILNWLNNPERHELCGRLTDGVLQTGPVPEALGREPFERWLWMGV